MANVRALSASAKIGLCSETTPAPQQAAPKFKKPKQHTHDHAAASRSDARRQHRPWLVPLLVFLVAAAGVVVYLVASAGSAK